MKADTELTAEDLKQICASFKKIYETHTKEAFPGDHLTQLTKAINAVFQSWNNPRAITYRNLNRIPHDLGTAVNIQSMVFGNMGAYARRRERKSCGAPAHALLTTLKMWVSVCRFRRRS